MFTNPVSKNMIRKKDYNLIPDINVITRDLTDKTQIQIVIDRFVKLNYKNKISIMINNIIFLPKILRKDFAVGIKILCELEILKARKKSYILHNQMVDMAIALNNQKILLYFFYLAKKYNFEPGIKTCNPGFLINFLSSFKEIPKNFRIYIPENIIEEIGLKDFMQKTFLSIITI